MTQLGQVLSETLPPPFEELVGDTTSAGNAMYIDQVIHDGAPVVRFFLVDFTESFGASTNPDGGILLLFPTQYAEWRQHEQYSEGHTNSTWDLRPCFHHVSGRPIADWS